ncbi:hypothetical protein D3C71_1611310 [compost metagenome]
MARARSSLPALDDVTMARSPAALASCRPQTDTPPVPRNNAVCPALAPPATNSAFQAVTAAQGRVEACSSLNEAGVATNAVSAKTRSVDRTPSVAAPGAIRVAAGVASPSIQSGKNAPITRSPGAKRVTALPTSITSPAASDAGMTGPDAPCRYSPRATIRSRKFSDTALMRTRTSCGPSAWGSRVISVRDAMSLPLMTV